LTIHSYVLARKYLSKKDDKSAEIAGKENSILFAK